MTHRPLLSSLPLAMVAALAPIPASVAAQPVISLSGSAEFGVTYDDGAADRTDPYGQYTLDIQPRTRLDNGLTVGVQTRMRGGDGRPTRMAGPRFYISTGGAQRLPDR